MKGYRILFKRESGSKSGNHLYILFLIVAIITTVTIPVHAEEERSWTIMVYMSGDNDLEPYALKDLDEMEKGIQSHSNKVTVIALLDKTGKDFELDMLPPDVASVVEATPGVLEWTGARLLLVSPDNGPGIDSVVLEDWGEVNMGDPVTLERFVSWSIENFPAEHYMLVIWDHGSGPGIVALDLDNGGDALTLREIRQALNNVGIRLDIVGFDACLMASVDTAYALRNIADYMVASEETEPGDGWDYEPMLDWLISHPDAGARELSVKIVDTYIAYYKSQGIQGVTLSVIDLGVYAKPEFENLVRKFTQEALDRINDIKNARINSLSFGGGTDPAQGGNQIDALIFLDALPGDWETAQAFRQAIASSIVYSQSWGDTVEGAGGITLHYPLRANLEAYRAISELGESLGWARMLEAAVNVPVQVEPPQQAAIPMVRLYTSLGIIGAFLQAAGGLDFDGDGADEFVVYGVGVEEATGDYMLALSLLKLIDNEFSEVYSDVIEWGAPLDDGSAPFEMAGAHSWDIDSDGLEEIFDAYQYYDGFLAYTIVDKIEFVDGVISYDYVIIENFLADWSSIGNFDGQGETEIILTGMEIDPEIQDAWGALYILSADTLETLYSYELDHPSGTLIYSDVTSGNLIPPVHGDEIVMTYNIIDPIQQTVIGARLLIATLGPQGLEVLMGTEIPGLIYSISAGDVDGDGVDELIVTMHLDKPYLSIVDVDGGEFVEQARFALEFQSLLSVAAEAYDIDGDGITEIMLGYSDETQQGVDVGVEIYAYLPQQATLQPEYATSLSAGLLLPVASDINGDSKPEIVYLLQAQDGIYAGASIIENYVDPTGTVSGMVTDADGRPIEGARVKISLPRSFSAKTTTDEQGRFNFTGVPEGTYQVEVLWRSPSGLVHEKILVNVKAGEETRLTITLEPQQATTMPPTETTTATTTQQTSQPQETLTETTSTQTTQTQASPTLTQTQEETITKTQTSQTQTATQSSPISPPTATMSTATESSPAPTTSVTTSQAGQLPTPTQTQSTAQTTAVTNTQQTQSEEGGIGVKPLVAAQVVIVLVLVVAIAVIRKSKKGPVALLSLSIAITALLLFSNAVIASAQATQDPPPPLWIYPGLRVVYSITSSETVVSPWSSGGFYHITVVGAGGGEQVSIPSEPGKTSSIRVFETYVVTSSEPGRVNAILNSWVEAGSSLLEGSHRSAEVTIIPLNNVFNGPFWIDPRLIANAREGDEITIPGENGARVYNVIVAERLDISPFSKERDSLEGRGLLSPQLPVPPHSYREVVVLQAMVPTPRGEQRHTMIVDRETGLILVETLGSVTGGVNQAGILQPLQNRLLVKSLSEIYLDLDNSLPPYEEYPQDPLVHAGYAYFLNGFVGNPLGEGYIVSLMFNVEGVYKNTLLLSQGIVIGPAGGTPVTELAMLKADRDNGRATVVFCLNPVTGGECASMSQGDTYDHVLLWIGRDAGREKVSIQGTTFYLAEQGTIELGENLVYKVFSYENYNLPQMGIDIAKLYYLENGLLAGVYLYVSGQVYQPATQLSQETPLAHQSSLEYMLSIPNTQPRNPTILQEISTQQEAEPTTPTASHQENVETTTNTIESQNVEKPSTNSQTSSMESAETNQISQTQGELAETIETSIIQETQQETKIQETVEETMTTTSQVVGEEGDKTVPTETENEKPWVTASIVLMIVIVALGFVLVKNLART